MPQRRTYKKRTYRKRAPSDKRVRAVVKSEMKKEIETKWHDRQSTGNIEYSNLTAVKVSDGLLRGTSPNTYIGSKLKIVGAEIRGHLLGFDSPYNIVRMVIIQTGANAFIPTNTILFGSGAISFLYAPFNKDYQDQYRLIKDKLIVLRNDGVAANSYAPTAFRYFISGKKLRQMQFTTSAGNDDGGQLYVCLVSDSTVAANPTFIMGLRLNYTDA